MIHSSLHLHLESWKALARGVAWLLAVIVVYRRRSYIEIALALLEYLFHFLRERHYPARRQQYGEEFAL